MSGTEASGVTLRMHPNARSAGSARAGLAPGVLLERRRSVDRDLDTAVLLPPRFRPVRRDGLALAEAHRRDVIRDAVLREIARSGFRAPDRELLVVLRATDRIGVA